jgi:hypothetical protein
LSGTAVALPATNTVFRHDIVNGEVSTKDISDSDGALGRHRGSASGHL